MDVLELDIALDLAKSDRSGFIGGFFFLVKELENTFGGSGGRLKHVGCLSRLHQRLVEGANVLHEGLNIAHLDASPDYQETAQNGDANVTQVTDEAHDGHH